MFRRRLSDALESAREDCSQGAPFYWRTVLPDPAPPPRHEPRRDPPVVCPGFGLDKFELTEQLGAENLLRAKKTLAEPLMSPESP